MYFTMMTVSAMESARELPQLTPEGFQKILNQVVFPQNYRGMTAQQARIVNSSQEGFLTSIMTDNLTEKKILEELLNEDNLKLPNPFSYNKNFNVRVESQNEDETLILNGFVNICAKNYDFNLTFYVFKDPTVKAKLILQNGKSCISPNVINQLGYFEEKVALERRQILAGIVKCNWKQEEKQSSLVINSLEVYPYQLTPRRWFRIDGLMKDLNFKGAYRDDLNRRADRIYDTLSLVARDILGAQAIIVKKKAVHPEILKNLTSVVDNKSGFKEIINNHKGTDIYELKLKKIPEILSKNSSESEYDSVLLELSGEEELELLEESDNFERRF